MALKDDRLHKSIIIAAHPDDEVLWFSSIIEEVDEIIICFLDVDTQPEWSKGRRDSLSAYPMARVSCLGLTESEVFDGANWANPVVAEYGFEVSGDRERVHRYKKNYGELVKLLGERLKGYANVFTHSPWGEYGHEEHVQLYRAVRQVQAGMPFHLWHTGYFSNKSAPHMNECLSRSSLEHYRLPTNKALAAKVMELYKRHHCWTWYDDYNWPDHESFILDSKVQSSGEKFGRTADLNFIKIWVPRERRRGPGVLLKRVMRKVAGMFR